MHLLLPSNGSSTCLTVSATAGSGGPEARNHQLVAGGDLGRTRGQKAAPFAEGSE